ncbi:hypothetical protein LOZ80_20040 [Paenibacillus sp. HWE-109]|uniref:hypothetical protein n=1 Tax=Paenibacillus sp. HWE-109 TaxID=1306526 RepID=UPI001EE0ABF2|nr:hypothetical protein [Paenibacillus sp. HWE-109]UKS23936.1 hypothetical protein LOZ80_20040 [Paenibacillus sp. HWE-109]
MTRWLAWTTACFISVSSLFCIPLQSSAGEGPNPVAQVERTSLAQAAQDDHVAKPVADLRSEATLQASINNWRAILAREAGFESWQSASWNSFPLGPGTHGWGVILTDHGQEVGYMIVYAAENGSFRLNEYGTGAHPLFSLTTLYRSLVQQELIPSTMSYSDFVRNEQITKNRLYMDALTAVWKVAIEGQTYYLDAKSGELLPLKEDPKPKLAEASLQGTDLQGAAITVATPSFDPYERLPWILGQPLPISKVQEFQSALKQHNNLTYVTELYGGLVTLPLAILGYQQWGENNNYLILDHMGARYVQLEEALAQGRIYK